MYKGESSVEHVLDLTAETLSITSVTGYTTNYESDEEVPTTSTVDIRAQVRNLSHNERKRYDTQYDVDKMLALILPKTDTISFESTFTRNGINYTIVGVENNINHKILYAKND